MRISKEQVVRNVNRLARRGERQNYGQIALQSGGSASNFGHIQIVIRTLCSMTHEDLEANRPVRAAAAVNAATGVPGTGLRNLMRDAGRACSGDWVMIADHEILRCAEHYGRRRS